MADNRSLSLRREALKDSNCWIFMVYNLQGVLICLSSSLWQQNTSYTLFSHKAECSLCPFFKGGFANAECCFPAFYTARYGYKVCLRVYLNGDGTGKGTHVSLFFVVMKGDYDALLPWPFRHKVRRATSSCLIPVQTHSSQWAQGEFSSGAQGRFERFPIFPSDGY